MEGKVITVRLEDSLRHAGLDHAMRDVVRLREGNRLLARIESKTHLTIRIAGTRPAHERVRPRRRPALKL